MVLDIKSLEREKKQLRDERDRYKAEALRGSGGSNAAVVERYRA
jgi:hypothetical protein